MNNKSLCAIGLVNHTWKRTYVLDREFVRCSTCKHVYSKIILESTICPRCNKPMQPEKHWLRRCTECGRQG